MRRLVLLTAVLLLLPALPALAADTPSVACPRGESREVLTLQGFETTFEAAAPLPDLAAVREATGGALTPFRNADFPFQADLAPAAGGRATISLAWANAANDYDLIVLDGDGGELAKSERDNPGEGEAGEQVQVDLDHCQRFTVWARNFAGAPAGDPITLTMQVTPGAATLACAQDDPAPNCAVKAAGEAPDEAVDTRTFLWLGGDPGQVSMINPFAATPFTATLSAQRPRDGRANTYTRPVAGFNNFRNPFLPHFHAAFPQPRRLVGTASALVWVSSPTLNQGGRLFVDLYVDGVAVGRAEIPGSRIRTSPTPVWATFPDLDVTEAGSVTLQVGTAPAVSSQGIGEPADASHTVWYGSVQFPSRLTLP